VDRRSPERSSAAIASHQPAQPRCREGAAEEARASWDEKQANEAVRARRLGDSATSVADVLERVQLKARVADRRMARRALEQRGGRHFDHAVGWPVSGQSPVSTFSIVVPGDTPVFIRAE